MISEFRTVSIGTVISLLTKQLLLIGTNLTGLLRPVCGVKLSTCAQQPCLESSRGWFVLSGRNRSISWLRPRLFSLLDVRLLRRQAREGRRVRVGTGGSPEEPTWVVLLLLLFMLLRNISVSHAAASGLETPQFPLRVWPRGVTASGRGFFFSHAEKFWPRSFQSSFRVGWLS